MANQIEAVYESGVFRPVTPVELRDGQKVSLSVEPVAMSLDEAKAELREWAKVYQGLSDADVAEIEEGIRDRGGFFPDRRGAA